MDDIVAATKRNSQAWKEAKKRCRLSNMDVRMAIEEQINC